MSRYSKPIEERVTELLCDLLARGETVFRTADIVDPNGLGALRGLGIVRDAGKVRSVTCLECDSAHPAAVELDDASGQLGWHCPEFGFIEASPREISATRLNWDRLVELLADSIDARGRRRQALIDGLLWRVGRFDSDMETIHVYLASGGLAADDFSRIAVALESEPLSDGGVVLCGGSRGLPGLHLTKRRRPLLLSDVLDVSANRIGLSRKAIAGAAGLGAPGRERPRGGRPSASAGILQVVAALEGGNDWSSMGTLARQRAIREAWSGVHEGERPPAKSTLLHHMKLHGLTRS